MIHEPLVIAMELAEFGQIVGERLLTAEVDLSRIRSAPNARLSHLSFEGQGAFPSQC